MILCLEKVQQTMHFSECLKLLAKAEETKGLVGQPEKGSSLPRESPSPRHGWWRGILLTWREPHVWFPLFPAISRDVRCGCDFYALLCSTFSMCCSFFFFLPFALGFMPFCCISSAFLFLGFYSHLKLLVHFRASCYMIKTEKGSHSWKHRMEKGTTEGISQAVMCWQSERWVGIFFFKTTTTSSVTVELGAWE